MYKSHTKSFGEHMENIEEKGLEADSHISKRIEVVSHRAARPGGFGKVCTFF